MSEYTFVWLDGRKTTRVANSPREAYEQILTRRPLKDIWKIEEKPCPTH